MKFSEIQNLYRLTDRKKPDAQFFKEFFQFCISSIESIADEDIKKAFKYAAAQNGNIVQFWVHEKNDRIYLDLFKELGLFSETVVGTSDQDFNLRGFCMWISLNPKIQKVKIGWPSNWFSKKEAESIFGNYLLEGTDREATVSMTFFSL